MKETYSERQKIIITAAIKLFLSKGYQSTGMREIAKMSDIEVSSIYSHFQSKQAIFLAICLGTANDFKIGLESILRNNSPIKKKIKDVIAFYIRLSYETEGRLNVFDQEQEIIFQEEMASLLQIRSGIDQLLLQILTLGVEQKKLVNLDAKILAKWFQHGLRSLNIMNSSLHLDVNTLTLLGQDLLMKGIDKKKKK